MNPLQRPHRPVQARLFPDPITPAQAAFERANRNGAAIRLFGVGENNHRQKKLCAALIEGLTA